MTKAYPSEPNYYWVRHKDADNWIPVEFLPCASDGYPIILFFGSIIEEESLVCRFLEEWEFGPAIEQPVV